MNDFVLLSNVVDIHMSQLGPIHFVHLVLPRKLLDVHGDNIQLHIDRYIYIYTVKKIYIYTEQNLSIGNVYDTCLVHYTVMIYLVKKMCSHRYLCAGPCWEAPLLVQMHCHQQNLRQKKKRSDIFETLYEKQMHHI